METTEILVAGLAAWGAIVSTISIILLWRSDKRENQSILQVSHYYHYETNENAQEKKEDPNVFLTINVKNFGKPAYLSLAYLEIAPSFLSNPIDRILGRPERILPRPLDGYELLSGKELEIDFSHQDYAGEAEISFLNPGMRGVIVTQLGERFYSAPDGSFPTVQHGRYKIGKLEIATRKKM